MTTSHHVPVEAFEIRGSSTLCPFGRDLHSAEVTLVTRVHGGVRGVSCGNHLAASRADHAKALRILDRAA